MFIDEILISIDLSSHKSFQAFWVEISFIFKKTVIFCVRFIENTISKLF